MRSGSLTKKLKTFFGLKISNINNCIGHEPIPYKASECAIGLFFKLTQVKIKGPNK